MDWFGSAMAVMSRALPIVTIYASLGEEGAAYGMQQTSTKLVIADAKLCKVLAKVLPNTPSTIDRFFLFGIFVVFFCFSSKMSTK